MFAIIIFVISSTRFADLLYAQDNYFRAITEYKRLLYYGLIDTTRAYDMISRCYAKRGKYNIAADYLSKSMLHIRDTLPIELKLQLSWYLIKSRKFFSARLVIENIKTSNAQNMRAISYIAEGKRDSAILYLKNKKGVVPRMTKYALYSTLIPGLGQIISGNFFEGFLSFLVVGGLGFYSYRALKDKDYFNFIFLGSWCLRFYRGNIEKARSLEKRRNEQIIKNLELELNELIKE